jgi:hypothetical protein
VANKDQIADFHPRRKHLKSWHEFSAEEPEIAMPGGKLLFRSREHVGFAYIATLRKDGAPRLHPISVILSKGHLYVVIPSTSPKCTDLTRDGRFAMQAFPPSLNEEPAEFYLAGCAERIQYPAICEALTEDTGVSVEENEVLFELLLERAMYTKAMKQDTTAERPIHRKWKAS